MSLKQYREKRDFKRTPEPKGKRGKKRTAERLYLIQNGRIQEDDLLHALLSV